MHWNPFGCHRKLCVKFSPLFWHRVHIHEIYGIIITFQFSCVDCCINEMRELVTKCLYLTEKKKKYVSVCECVRAYVCMCIFLLANVCMCIQKQAFTCTWKQARARARERERLKNKKQKSKTRIQLIFIIHSHFFADDYVHQIESILSHTHTFLSVSFSFARIFKIKRK